MTEKLCRKCGVTKDLVADFNRSADSPSGRRGTCRRCDARRNRARYVAGGRELYEEKKQTIETRRREIITRIYRYLLSHPCVGCGEADPIVLDFDHVRGEKLAGVSQLVSWARKWEVILAEIEKCDVRCANCHRRKTAKQLNWYSYIPEVDYGRHAAHDII